LQETKSGVSLQSSLENKEGGAQGRWFCDKILE
jgi:hypothetical protein